LIRLVTLTKKSTTVVVPQDMGKKQREKEEKGEGPGGMSGLLLFRRG
jgi:hypothetical protein